MDRKSATILGVIFIGLFLALFAFVGLAIFAVSGGQEGGSAFKRGGAPAVGVVEIRGVIERSEKVLAQLRKFASDDQVKAILVRIDSPGGSVGPSQEIYGALRALKGKKPVVCSMGSVAASGGYYIAAGCPTVFANAGTLTGSIGVISQMPYLGEIAQKVDFEMITIKSGQNKDVGNAFRRMTPEEQQLMQSMLDQVHEQFIRDIMAGRGLTDEEVRPWADGRVLTGEKALELKLIDALGNFDDALQQAAAEGGIEGEPKLKYPQDEKPLDLLQLLNQGSEAMADGVISALSKSASGVSTLGAPTFLMSRPTSSK